MKMHAFLVHGANAESIRLVALVVAELTAELEGGSFEASQTVRTILFWKFGGTWN